MGKALEDTKIHARQFVDKALTHLENFVDSVKVIYTQGMYLDLGYSTWADFCEAEFGNTFRLAIDGDERSDMVEAFEGVGMSLREIEAATGISRRTLSRSTNGANAPVDDHETEVSAGEPDIDADAPDAPGSEVERVEPEFVEAELIEDDDAEFASDNGKTKTAAKGGLPEAEAQIRYHNKLDSLTQDIRVIIQRLSGAFDDPKFTATTDGERKVLAGLIKDARGNLLSLVKQLEEK